MSDKNYLKDCHTQYLESFPDNWISSINFSEYPDIKTALDKISDFFERSFILFSQSAICGEYIYSESFEADISSYKNHVSIEYTPSRSAITDTSTEESHEKSLSDKFQALNVYLFDMLAHYQDFFEFAKVKFDTRDQLNRYTFFSPKEPNDSKSNEFIFYTLPICKYDYRFPANDANFIKLLNIHASLSDIVASSNPELRKIHEVLLYKCNFVIRRLKTRSLTFYSDSKVKEIIPENLDLGVFQKLFNEIKPLNTTVEELEKCEKDITTSTPNLSSFVLLMRHYKNNLSQKKDISKFNSVIVSFDNFYNSKENSISVSNSKSLKDDYDNFSLNTVRNFIYNCRFSFLAKHGDLSLKEIKTHIRDIEKVQAKTNVLNFHPYEKAIDAIIKCIKRHFETQTLNESLIDEKFDELNTLIDSYTNSLLWSRTHKFFPFQLTFDESICEFDDLKIFIPSTFAKIIDYEEQSETLEKFKREKENLIFQYRFSKDRQEIEKDRQEIELLKNDIVSSEKKSFELLALFTAVITFLFGSASIFSGNKEAGFQQLIINTSGLGVILLLFVSLFLLVSPFVVARSSSDIFKKNLRRFIFSAIFCISYLVVVIVFSNNLKNGNDVNSKNTKIEKLEKSVKDQQTKIEKLENSSKQPQGVVNLNLNYPQKNK